MRNIRVRFEEDDLPPQVKVLMLVDLLRDMRSDREQLFLLTLDGRVLLGREGSRLKVGWCSDELSTRPRVLIHSHPKTNPRHRPGYLSIQDINAIYEAGIYVSLLVSRIDDTVSIYSRAPGEDGSCYHETLYDSFLHVLNKHDYKIKNHHNLPTNKLKDEEYDEALRLFATNMGAAYKRLTYNEFRCMVLGRYANHSRPMS